MNTLIAPPVPAASIPSPTPALNSARGVVIGVVKSVDADGRIWLNLPAPGPDLACAACCLCLPSELAPGRRVAVLFQEQNAGLAVVLGPVLAEMPIATEMSAENPDTLLFEAEKQITLKCGKSSIKLQPDGSVLIRGAYVLTRASGTNRIRGGNVQIN